MEPTNVDDFGTFRLEEFPHCLIIRATEEGKQEIRSEAIGRWARVRFGLYVVYDFDQERWRVASKITDEEILDRPFGSGFGHKNDPKSESNIDSEMGFIEFMEPALGNGWDLIDPGVIGAMTEAPILTKDADEDEDFNAVPYPGQPVYWHRSYMVESPLRSMLEQGFVRFDRAEED